MDDNEIVELYLSRNEEAINQTAKKYGSALRKIAFGILSDEETVKECENDTYLQTWNLIPPHEPRTYLFPFTGRIIRHIALNVCKKNSAIKRYAKYVELTEEMQECIPAESNTEGEALSKYLTELINEFLSGCSDEQQKIFVRRYFYFDRVEDIAKAYGFSVSKVKTTLFRLRGELKKQLERGGYTL